MYTHCRSRRSRTGCAVPYRERRRAHVIKPVLGPRALLSRSKGSIQENTTAPTCVPRGSECVSITYSCWGSSYDCAHCLFALAACPPAREALSTATVTAASLVCRDSKTRKYLFSRCLRYTVAQDSMFRSRQALVSNTMGAMQCFL